jgi:hypothetical protein
MPGAVPPPLALRTAECPEPEAPPLPQLDAVLFLDSPENCEALLARDDASRAYIAALRSALRCYRRQAAEPPVEEDEAAEEEPP